MKKFISIFIILAVSVSLFLVSVSAETYEDFLLNLDYKVQQYPSENVSLWRVQTINNKQKYEFSTGPSDIPMDYNTKLKFEVGIYNSTNSVFIKAGEEFDFSLTGIYLTTTLDSTSYIWNKIPENMYLELYYTDSTFTRLYDFEWSFNSGTNTQSVTYSGLAEKDIYKIEFYEDIRQNSLTRQHGTFDTSITMGSQSTATYLKVEIESKEEALLGDINSSLDNIANGDVEANRPSVDSNVNNVIGEENTLNDKVNADSVDDNINSIVDNSVGSLVSYIIAFNVVSGIFNTFAGLPIINQLLHISLLLGIFMVLVNLVPVSLTKFNSSDAKPKKQSTSKEIMVRGGRDIV